MDQEKDPIEENLLYLRGQIASMFPFLDGFKAELNPRKLARYEALRKRHERLSERQRKDFAILNQLKSNASTMEEASECVARLRALFEKHTEQLIPILDRLIDLTRVTLRGPKKR